MSFISDERNGNRYPNIDESLRSEGEVFPLKYLEDVEAKIKKNEEKKKRQKSSESTKKNYIDIRQFHAYLEQLQNASSHNLAYY